MYKNIKFLDEDEDFTLDGLISKGLQKELYCMDMKIEEWSKIWDKYKKMVLYGHQSKRSEHGTKARNKLFGKSFGYDVFLLCDIGTHTYIMCEL